MTAAERQIKDGDVVKIASEFGEVESPVRITPAIVPGAIAISHHCGHWEYGRYASGKYHEFAKPDNPDDGPIWWRDGKKFAGGAHPNWVIGNKADPISGELRWMDTVVKVTKSASA